ncbi:MAG: hypothetical protein LUI87_12790 [Lachnospiraceae bacterium]|nr:hypothetical protein [Lachnospiraceae bacterium]
MKKKISPEIIDAFTDDMSMTTFFEKVAQEFALSVSGDTVFDCRKITIASDIIERWYETAEQKHGKESLPALTRHLLLFGPKENKALKNGETEVMEGFLAAPACERRKHL